MSMNYCTTGSHQSGGEKMEKYIEHPFCQADELSVSPSITFDTCGMWRMDAAAEQHLQRLAARDVFVGENNTLPDLHDPKGR
jgi:hypothetical protein